MGNSSLNRICLIINKVTQGMQRMLWGFKELVISERMALIVNTIYGNYEAYPGYISG